VLASAATAEGQLIEDIASYCHDPLGCVRYSFPWGESGELDGHQIRHWQADILSAIGDHLRSPSRFVPLQLAVASGHGIGKSALVGQIIHWALSTCDDALVVVTANTGDQLTTKTVPEVSKWFRLAINAHWWRVGTEAIKVVDPKHEKTWRADFLTWSLERSEAFAGLHNKGRRIVLIFDEASAIPDKIWEVAEGAMTDEQTEIIWLAFGNPTQNTGRFRECFGKLKHRWITRQIDSRGVEGTNKQQLDKWVADYGEDSDFCRVRVRGEFPRAGSSQFIPSDLVAAARKRVLSEELYRRHWKIMSVDVARFGDDQSIIGYVQGRFGKIIDKVRKQDTVFVGDLVIQRICEHKPRTCIVDGDGIGGGVVDHVRAYLPDKWQAMNGSRLPETFALIEFHGGTPASDPFMYFNKRAEAWGKMRTWIETAQVPDDPELETDLTGPEYGFSSKNQIQLERKEDMKKRGLASPDTADMFAMALTASAAAKTEEESLADRLASIKDPLWRSVQQIKATLDKERRPAYDDRPEWMREG